MLHDKMDTTVREMQAKIDSYEEGNRKLLKEKFAAETKCEQLQCSLKSHEKQLETLVENNESCHEKLRVAEGRFSSFLKSNFPGSNCVQLPRLLHFRMMFV